MKEVIVLIGNYGSGKTELALNFAFRAARFRLRLLRSVAAPLPKKMLRLFSGTLFICGL